MALRILGIDLGTHSVKVAELSSSFRTIELLSLQRVPLAVGGAAPLLADQLATLSTMTFAQQSRPDVVVVALPGAGAATHRLVLPFSDVRRLEQTLAFEVEGQIPFDLADVLYDYEVLSQTPARGKVAARSEVLVGVARRPAVTHLIEALHVLHFDPRIVTLPGLALQQLPLPALGADVILDLGHTRVGIVARENGRPMFARSFEGGGAVLTAALARARGLEWAAAEALKEQSSLVDGDPEIQQLLTRAFLPVVREIRQTLKQVAGADRKPLERLWITGGTALLHGLPEVLLRELNIPVEALPNPALPGIDLRREESQLGSLALGLALRGQASARSARFNLRRGDQTFQGDFARTRGRLTRVAAFAAVLFLLFGVRAYAEFYVLGKREKQIDDAICAQTKQAVGKCVKDPLLARGLLAAGGAGEGTIPDQSAVGLLAEVTTRMAVEGTKVNEMEVGVDQLQLVGEADSFETVDKVVNALKGYHCFGEVQRGRVQRSHDAQQIEFNLSARVDCSQGVLP